MLTVTFGALPASGRPSDCAASAVDATKFAWTSGPGTLCIDPLICTSTRGIVKDPRNFTCVRNFVSTWQ